MKNVSWGEGRTQVVLHFSEIEAALASGLNARLVYENLKATGKLSITLGGFRTALWRIRKKLAKSYSQSNQSLPPFAVERSSSVAPAPLSPTSLPSSSGSLSAAEQVRSAPVSGPVDGFRRSHTVPEDLL